jgi:hypothetical protein
MAQHTRPAPAWHCFRNVAQIGPMRQTLCAPPPGPTTTRFGLDAKPGPERTYPLIRTRAGRLVVTGCREHSLNVSSYSQTDRDRNRAALAAIKFARRAVLSANISRSRLRRRAFYQEWGTPLD